MPQKDSSVLLILENGQTLKFEGRQMILIRLVEWCKDLIPRVKKSVCFALIGLDFKY